MIKLRSLINEETHLEKLNKELRDHVRHYKIAKDANNEWEMKEQRKKIKIAMDLIKKEKTKSPEEIDKDEFLRHHYTGYIPSTAYSRSEKEGGLSWLGDKSKYPILLDKGQYGPFEVEFRQTGNRNDYVKHDDLHIARDNKGHAIMMTPDEIAAEELPVYDETIVAFVNDKPIGLASNEFGAVGIWVEGPYQKQGIGLALLDKHIEQRPRVKSGKAKLGQMTNAGISLTKKYHDLMTKKHGVGWFNKTQSKL